MNDIRKPIFDVIRQVRGRGFSTMEVAQVDDLLDRLQIPRAGVAPRPSSGKVDLPPWLAEAWKDIGVREIVGPRHEPRVLAYSKELGRPYTDDETAWCGLAMGAWIKRAGYPVVSIPERALSWSTYGTPTKPRVGAIAVKPRPGGNHVFQLTGITADGTRYKGIGGNQSNAVTETDFLVEDVKHLRWPPGAEALPFLPLPIKDRGTISTNEA